MGSHHKKKYEVLSPLFLFNTSRLICSVSREKDIYKSPNNFLPILNIIFFQQFFVKKYIVPCLVKVTNIGVVLGMALPLFLSFLYHIVYIEVVHNVA